jgi:FkbM family methyltransferase
MLRRSIGKVGSLLPRGVRRLVLDRLGGARAAAWLSGEAFETVRIADSIVLAIKPILHASLTGTGALDYESNLVRLLEERLGRGAVFYDVGANVGIFTFLAGLRVGAEGTVVAFEPEPNNIICLRRSIDLNRLPADIRLMEIAVADRDGSLAFDRRGGAFSGRVVAAGSNDGPAASVIEVPARSIDSLVAGGEIPPPNLVKIDVEGGEGAVVAGMQRTLADHRPEVLVEMHGFARPSVEQACAILEEHGYGFHRVDGYAGGPLPPAREPRERLSARHVLALPGGA